MKIDCLKFEINNSRAFISSEIISMYTKLYNNAERFLAHAEKHNQYSDYSKEDHERKTELRNIAYESREKFEDDWKKTSEEVNKYLCAEETV